MNPSTSSTVRTLTLPPMGQTPSAQAAAWLVQATAKEQDFWALPPTELAMNCLSYQAPRPIGSEATVKRVQDWNRNVTTARKWLGQVAELLPPGPFRDSDVPGIVSLTLWHMARLAFFNRFGR